MALPDLDRLGVWADLPFFRETWPGITAQLEGEAYLPPAPKVFAALEQCQPEDTRVLILGQDPYPTPGHANGLAFSVAPDVAPLPASLKNIYRELRDDLGITRPNGDLTGWAREGVLLLNTALTVPPGDAHGHKDLGWDRLVAQILRLLDALPRALLLWGNPAQKVACQMRNPDHLRIETSHASPLAARHSFFGSRPFSRINGWLTSRGQPAIDWSAT